MSNSLSLCVHIILATPTLTTATRWVDRSINPTNQRDEGQQQQLDVRVVVEDLAFVLNLPETNAEANARCTHAHTYIPVGPPPTTTRYTRTERRKGACCRCCRCSPANKRTMRRRTLVHSPCGSEMVGSNPKLPDWELDVLLPDRMCRRLLLA